jgi:hypothetical protein
MKRALHLDPADRAELAEKVLDGLRRASPGSRAEFRGSLGQGTADQYSDIDVRWEVPDADFPRCVAIVRSVLDGVRPVESLRSDPDFQNSRKRRLFFARFRNAPLFWRLDLEVFARSIGGDETYDVGNPNARGSDWSATESALANAVAAIKAHLRQDDQEAHSLVTRAYHRVGLSIPDLELAGLVLNLVDQVTSVDRKAAAFAKKIKKLAEAVFGNSR